MDDKLRKTAIDIVGNVPWGTHLCQFYQGPQDLTEIMVPYFEAGLQSNEFCVWITSQIFGVEDATQALAQKVENLDHYLRKGQLEILDYKQWYLKAGRFNPDAVLRSWHEKEKQARKKGYDGLRGAGDMYWLEKKDWKSFNGYEAKINRIITDHRMIAVCCYCLDKCSAAQIVDVVGNHQRALIKRDSKWETIEIAEYKRSKEERERLLRAVETTREGIVITAPDGTIEYSNDAADKLFGYDEGQLPGRSVSILNIGPAPAKLMKQVIKTALKDGFWEGEIRSKRRDGGEFVNLCSVSVVKNNKGRVVSIVSTHHDITERKQAEQAIRESEKKYRDLVETMNEGLGVTDESYAFTYVNNRFAQMLGYSYDRIVGHHVTEFLDEENKKRIERQIVQRRAGVSKPYDLTWTTSNGRKVATMISPMGIYNSKGNFLSSFGAITDITERKRAEEALKHSEERYSLAQRAANIGIWDWDITTGQLVWSEHIEPMFGFEPGQFGGTYEAFLKCVHPEDRCHITDSVAACTENGREYAIEHRIVWPDGSTRWVSETGDVIRDENHRAVRMLGVVQDITERKNAEARQQLASQVLETLNQTIDQEAVLRGVLSLIKQHTGFDAVGIRLRKGDDFPYFVFDGFSKEFIEAENYLCAKNQSGEPICDLEGTAVLECMCGTVISDRADPSLPIFTRGGSFWTNCTTRLLASSLPLKFPSPTRNRCNKAGYESVALVPLRCGDQILGLLQLNDKRPSRFSLEMISFFEGICTSIATALARVRAEQEVEGLAKFPSENPSPVLRIAKDGTVLYANAAGSELLNQWDCEVGMHAPESWHQYILRILKSGLSEGLEVICKDRVLYLTLAPVTRADYVNIYGSDITEHKQAEDDLRRYRKHLEELVEARTAELTDANKLLRQEIEGRKRLENEILNISEREQRRIGRELHDSLGQQLTGVAIMTKVLEQKLRAKLLDESTDVEQLGVLVSQALDQTRDMSKGLYPVSLDSSGVVPALQELASRTSHLFGISCSFKQDRPVLVEDTAVALHLYRIAQEAINNAVKHGRAKNIRIELCDGSGESVLTIKSDGLDFPGMQAAKQGLGLRIMAYRAEMIDGRFEVSMFPEGGTLVCCRFKNNEFEKAIE